MALTPKQIRFCEEYLIDLNATQAAIRAGYSEKTAAEQSSRLLTNVKIQSYIAERQKILSEKLNISQERILQEYARIGFSDIRKYFTEEGSLKSVHELDDDAAAALAAVESDEITMQGQSIGQTKKIKIWGKREALDSMCKMLGYNAPEKQEVNMGITWKEEKTYEAE